MLKLFTFVQTAAYSLRNREEGQTMAEYGVVLAVITLAVIGAITLLSDNVRAAIQAVRPWAVDASSRLEVEPGVKDPERVRAFVEAAQ